MGNLDLLLEAGRLFGDARLLSRAYTMAAGVLQSIREHGWLCGVPAGVETPGLMVGVAGIGFGALRLADPARVPSVLTLRPPVARGGL
jgi:lantibiotic modifying enzyme